MKKSFLILVTICTVFSSTVFAQEPESKSDYAPRLVPYNFQGKSTVNLYWCYPDPLNLQGSVEPLSETGQGATFGYFVKQFLMAEFIGGLGMTTGVLVGPALFRREGWDGLAAAIVIGYTSYTLGVAFGVHGTGYKQVQNGTYWRALEGSLFGACIGMTIAAIEKDSKTPVFTGPALLLMPTICSMINYNRKFKSKYPNRFKETGFSPEISVGQLGYYQDACGGPGIKLDLLSYRF